MACVNTSLVSSAARRRMGDREGSESFAVTAR